MSFPDWKPGRHSLDPRRAAPQKPATAAMDSLRKVAAVAEKGRPRPGHDRIHSPCLRCSHAQARGRYRAWRRLHRRWLRPGQRSGRGCNGRPRRKNLRPKPNSPHSSTRWKRVGFRSSTAPVQPRAHGVEARSQTHRDGVDALQAHLVQLVQCLEPCSLGATAGTPARDEGSWRRCGSDAVQGGEKVEQKGVNHHHGLRKVVRCMGTCAWHLMWRKPTGQGAQREGWGFVVRCPGQPLGSRAGRGLVLPERCCEGVCLCQTR